MTTNSPSSGVIEGLAAIVTTYRPNDDFVARFKPLLSVCARIIVVDNSPDRHAIGEGQAGFVVFHDGANKGLGRALNMGLAHALRSEFTHAVLFDQDSTPDCDLVSGLKQLLDRRCADHGPLNCVGPTLLDDSLPATALSAREGVSEDANGYELVDCLATSGLLINLGALSLNDLFTEDFFLDFVDYEWCWRMGHQGWHFARSRTLAMPHRLGLGERKFLGITYHVPPPFRHYFQFRESIRLVRLGYVPIRSRLRLLYILPLKLLAYPFLLGHAKERLSWMAKGVIDACRGVRGVGAAEKLLCR